jgi:predicted phosphoribosyltransferase
MTSQRVLLVADRTAAGPHVVAALRARAARGPSDVTLLVPATPLPGRWTWEEGKARREAKRRMRAAASRLKRSGFAVRPVLGDFSAIEAIGDELRQRSYDEIVISTLPTGRSKWLKQDLPARVARKFDVPVTHIEAGDDREDPGTLLRPSTAA